MEQVIGLDIGGTKITGVVYDGKTVLRELTAPTPRNLTAFKKAVAKIADLLSAGRQIKGLGVGLAGIVGEKGAVIYSPNMKFLENFNFGRFCKDLNFRKVQIDNDANCFALAEARLGRGRGYKNFVGVTLGTGVGGGIIYNGELFRGGRGSAGEVGHIMADFKYDSEHYYQVARDKKDYKKMGGVLGLLFANIINILDVEMIVLGGTVAVKYSGDFLPHALKIIRKHVVNKNSLPKIIVSNLKNSGSLGAALLVT